VAEREGLTPAEAAAAAHGIGDKVKPTLSEAGASEAREMTGREVRLLQSMPGSRRRRRMWRLVGYAALDVVALAGGDFSRRRVRFERRRTHVDDGAGMQTSGEDHRQPEMHRASEPDRGRHADTPADIPLRGWGDILLRVYNNIGKDRVITIAAGVTFYSLLAMFSGHSGLGGRLRPVR
jgi:hypothetical protein